MERPEERLEEAQVRGRSTAETFDRKLRERELAEREARLTRMAWGAEDEPLAPWSNGREPNDEVWRLQQDVERLAAFHRAVLQSKGWRVLQALRRPFGRNW